MGREPSRFARSGVAATAAATIVAAATAATLAGPARSDPLAGTDEIPTLVFLTRNDVPFDSLAASAAAAQLGAPVVITSPTVLSEPARQAIVDAAPDVIVVAGGTAAVSEQVAAEAAAACDPDCTVDRRGGAGRDATAALIAELTADYGVTRPAVAGSGQVVGDVHVGGTLHVDDLTVQDGTVVDGLNADRLDGLHAADLAKLPVTTSGLGRPRLADPPVSGVTVSDQGWYVEFQRDPGGASSTSVIIDLPGPTAIGGERLALTGLELCYRINATESAIVEATVFHATPDGTDTTATWNVSGVGYNTAAGLPQCAPLGPPPIDHLGPMTLQLVWQESESMPTSLAIRGLTATWNRPPEPVVGEPTSAPS